MTEKHGRVEHEVGGIFIINDATDISPEVAEAFAQASKNRAKRHMDLIERYVLDGGENASADGNGDDGRAPAEHERP